MADFYDLAQIRKMERDELRRKLVDAQTDLENAAAENAALLAELEECHRELVALRGRDDR